MQTRQWAVRSGLVLSVFGAAGLMTALPAAAQTQKAPTTTEPAKPSTMAPSRAGDDDSAEFAKLDKNKDGFIDKSEAILEPRLMSNFDAADTNKDGKIDKAEWSAFQKNKNLVVKKQ